MSVGQIGKAKVYLSEIEVVVAVDLIVAIDAGFSAVNQRTAVSIAEVALDNKVAGGEPCACGALEVIVVGRGEAGGGLNAQVVHRGIGGSGVDGRSGEEGCRERQRAFELELAALVQQGNVDIVGVINHARGNCKCQ